MVAFDRIKKPAVVNEVINKLFLRIAEVLRRNLVVNDYHNFSGTWWIPSAPT